MTILMFFIGIILGFYLGSFIAAVGNINEDYDSYSEGFINGYEKGKKGME